MANIEKTLDLTTIKDALPTDDIEITVAATAEGLDPSATSNVEKYNSVDALIFEYDEYGDYIVAGIADNRTSADIPRYHNDIEVVGIKAGAFLDNEILTAVTIPSSVKFIGASAFENCSSLSSVEIEDGAIRIYFVNRMLWREPCCWMKYADGTLSSAPGEHMTRVGVDDQNYDVYKVNLRHDTEIVKFGGYDQNTGIFEYLNEFNVRLNNIPNNAVFVSTYGSNEAILDPLYDIDAVYDYSDYVLSIGEGAFANCPSLTKFNIPNSVLTLDRTFDGSAISKLYLSDHYMVREITNRAFSGTNISGYFPYIKTLRTIGANAFENCRFEGITLPKYLQTIGDSAFEGCEYLASVSLDTNDNGDTASVLISIGDRAFAYTKLTKFTFPSKLTHIGSEPFANGNETINSSLLSATFEDPYGWVKYDNNTLAPTPVSPNTMSAGNLSTVRQLELTDSHLTKFDTVPAPTISITGDILTITDPIGLAEKFVIYANGKEVHRIDV